jgi:hypothetical protein
MALALSKEAEAAQERTKLSRDHNVASVYLLRKLADLEASGDAGSRTRQIAENLVADCATRSPTPSRCRSHRRCATWAD